MRIDKFLCECGVGTRSEVKKNIKNKLVTCNGEVITKADVKIDEASDRICYKGTPLQYEKFSYYLLHKPAGCVTAKTDATHGTVMDFLPEDIHKDCAPVGRLDLDTEGLLLITNDGELTHHLLSPSHHIPKTYYLVVDEEIPQAAVEAFKQGIDIGDEKPTLPATLEIIEEANNESTILPRHSAYLTISEGRFHQVKRMMHSLGCEVTYLKRISMGPLTLGDLKRNEYRKLTVEEISLLKS